MDAFLASAAAFITGGLGGGVFSAFLWNMEPGGRSLGSALRLKAPSFPGGLAPEVLDSSGGEWSLMNETPYFSDWKEPNNPLELLHRPLIIYHHFYSLLAAAHKASSWTEFNRFLPCTRKRENSNAFSLVYLAVLTVVRCPHEK